MRSKETRRHLNLEAFLSAAASCLDLLQKPFDHLNQN